MSVILKLKNRKISYLLSCWQLATSMAMELAGGVGWGLGRGDMRGVIPECGPPAFKEDSLCLQSYSTSSLRQARTFCNITDWFMIVVKPFLLSPSHRLLQANPFLTKYWFYNTVLWTSYRVLADCMRFIRKIFVCYCHKEAYWIKISNTKKKKKI